MVSRDAKSVEYQLISVEAWAGGALADAVGIGVVGVGFAGRMHALAARMLGARLVGVTSSSPERSKAAADLLGAEQAFPSATDLIDDPRVEIVHICTPNASHAELATKALERGKHVVCEKPLATTVADAARLADLAERSGFAAAVCFNYRYQSMTQEARARVRSGELGAVRLVHGTYLQDWLLYPTDTNWRTLFSEGGPSRAFADIGSHWCDLAEWITGERITELAAVTSTVFERRPHPERGGLHSSDPPSLVQVDNEDAACVVFRASNDVIGSLTVSQVSPGRKNRLWIEVDAAKSSVAYNQENAEWLFVGARESDQLVARDGSSPHERYPHASALPPGHARGFVETFAQLFSDVYQTARNGSGPAFPTFRDGARIVAITEAVLQAAASREWVRVE